MIGKWDFRQVRDEISQTKKQNLGNGRKKPRTLPKNMRLIQINTDNTLPAPRFKLRITSLATHCSIQLSFGQISLR